jgi:hypothetical protein
MAAIRVPAVTSRDAAAAAAPSRATMVSRPGSNQHAAIMGGSETTTSVNSRSSRGGRPEDFHGMVLLPCAGQAVMDPPEV